MRSCRVRELTEPRRGVGFSRGWPDGSSGDMKVAVVGAGSTYTPELVDGLLRRREPLGLDEIALVDPDRRRLAVIGPLAERMVERAGGGVKVSDCGADLVAGVERARFVVSQIRVGGQAARDADERFGREFGLIGQETVGIGGLANALRTIPVALAIAQTVADHAPDATLLNFTNPAGLVTEALCRHGPVPAIGLCNAPWGFKAALAGSPRLPAGGHRTGPRRAQPPRVGARGHRGRRRSHG